MVATDFVFVSAALGALVCCIISIEAEQVVPNGSVYLTSGNVVKH